MMKRVHGTHCIFHQVASCRLGGFPAKEECINRNFYVHISQRKAIEYSVHTGRSYKEGSLTKGTDYDKQWQKSCRSLPWPSGKSRGVEAEKSRFANICLARSDHDTLVKTMTMHAVNGNIICSFAPSEKNPSILHDRGWQTRQTESESTHPPRRESC